MKSKRQIRHNDKTVDTKEHKEPDHRVRVAAERRERMREHLVVVGLSVAARKGAEGFSIDDVVVAAEVARGTFYKYFQSPAELVRAVALDLAEELIQTVHALVRGLDDPALQVALGLRAVLRFVRAVPLVGAFITRAGWPHSEPGHAFFRLVASDLDRGMAQGRFRVAHRELGLILIGGLCVGAMQSLEQGSVPEEFPEQVAETLLVGLGLPRDEAATLARVFFELPPINPDGLIARSAARG